MKEMILRSVDLKKNGDSFPLMGVTDNGFKLIRKVTVTDGSSDVRYLDIPLSDDGSAVKFKSARLILRNVNGVGGTNYLHITNGNNALTKKPPIYFNSNHSIVKIDFEVLGTDLFAEITSSINGYSSTANIGMGGGYDEGITTIRLVMNGDTSALGTGTVFEFYVK